MTRWPRVFLLWVCGVLAGMQFAKVSVAFQALQALYSVTPTQIGLVLSTVGLVGLVLGVTMGLCAPTVGYRRLLLAGLGLGAVVSALQAMLPPFPLLLASRMLEGASHLAVVVAAPTLIAASCAPAHRSIVMGLWSTFVGVAFAITAAVGGPIMARLGVEGLLLAHAVGMALLAVAAWLALRHDRAIAPPGPLPGLRQLLYQHAEVYRVFDTALPGLCFLCYTATAVALLTYIPPWAGPDQSWLAVVLPLMVIAGNFSAGWLVLSSGIATPRHSSAACRRTAVSRSRGPPVASSASSCWRATAHSGVFIRSGPPWACAAEQTTKARVAARDNAGAKAARYMVNAS